jgi:D-3-phosphoglycerate dehydrogenase
LDRTPLILVTEPIADVGLHLLANAGELRTPWVEGRTFNDEDLRQASALIVRLVPVTASLIGKAANLKVIGRHGAGLDTVDIRAATSRRIPVVYTPLANANAVAEHAVHLILSLARHTVAGDRAVRESRFDLRDALIGFELRHQTLGVVGLGGIGLRVAEIAHKGFDMRILAYDPIAGVLSPSHNFVKRTDTLRELLQQADVVTLHSPLTPETHHMVNPESLGWMKSSALLINTSRGAVIDTKSLAEAIKSGKIAGAALDVFEDEPLPADHPLQSTEQVLFSPHIGGSTREARERMSELVARQVVQVLKGELPKFLANPDALRDWPSDGQIASFKV